MITLAPINIDVQDTLNQKIAMMKKGEAGYVYKNLDTGKWNTGGLDSFNQPLTMTETLDATGMPGVPNYMFARSPWLRVTSFTPIGTNQPLILMGGELNSFGEMAGDFTSPDEFVAGTEYDFDIGRGAKYYQQDKKYNMPYRPMPGVKDISVEYKGGGMKLGATRGGQINWTCWTWEELERLTPHFLAPRRTVLLEWGWSMKGIESGIYDLYDTDSDGNLVFSPDKVNNLSQELPKHILDQKGHYDAMLGLIQNFEWSVNEQGGFDCTTNIIAPGVTLLQTKGKAEDKYKNFASLPLYTASDEFEDEGALWKETEKIAPYLTYREYMSDLGSQIFHISMERCKDIKGDNAHTRGEWKNKRASLPILSLDRFGIGGKLYLHNVNVLGDYHFVSWGWFEDNVLSRFFGQVNSNAEGTEEIGQKVISEFRSIEHSTDINGKLEYYMAEPEQPDWWDPTKDGAWNESTAFNSDKQNPILKSTRFANSPYLMTLNTSKWLIPNRDDIIFGNPKFRWRPIVDGNDTTLKKIYSPPVGTDYMEIRNIFFNVGYLSRMSKKVNDLTSVVTSIWDDFARSYGDVFKFKIDYDDVNKRMLLREEGYTRYKVNDILENKKKILAGEEGVGAGIFEFPVMEAGSIVKTNTINAKLPDRMQVAAMYGVRKMADEDKSTKDYDELVGNAWGIISEDLKDDPVPTEEEKKLKRRKDMMTGNIDYPSKMNRSFGRKDANLNKPLFVGTIKFDEEGSQPAGDGTQIRPSIINNVNETQKEYMNHMAKVHHDGTEKDIDKKKLENIYLAANNFRLMAAINRKEFLNKGLKWYEVVSLSTIKWGTNGEDEDGTYSEAVNKYKKFNSGVQEENLKVEKKYMESIKVNRDNNSGHIHLKPLFSAELTKLLRGDSEGVLANISPLVPVDFEMEIDGTGGMFPGNSFHSSYLGTRYREETLFQMIGVDHSVDSSGWTTTVKGQIRAKPTAMPRSVKEMRADLKRNKEESVALVAKQKEIQAQEEATARQTKIDLANAATEEERIKIQEAAERRRAEVIAEVIAANKKAYEAELAKIPEMVKILHTELITDVYADADIVSPIFTAVGSMSTQGRAALNAAFSDASDGTSLDVAIQNRKWGGNQDIYRSTVAGGGSTWSWNLGG